MTLYVGVDPGLSGAIALMAEDGVIHHVGDLPVVEYLVGKKKRRRLDGRTLAESPWLKASNKYSVVIEEVASMPKQGVASTFNFGRACGVIEGVVAALGMPYRFVRPQVWKKAMDIPTDKEAARLAVIQRYPDAASFLTRRRDHNRAEAVALADYLRRER